MPLMRFIPDPSQVDANALEHRWKKPPLIWPRLRTSKSPSSAPASPRPKTRAPFPPGGLLRCIRRLRTASRAGYAAVIRSKGRTEVNPFGQKEAFVLCDMFIFPFLRLHLRLYIRGTFVHFRSGVEGRLCYCETSYLPAGRGVAGKGRGIGKIDDHDGSDR